MSSVFVECPECNWEGQVPEEHLGKRVKCPKCQESFLAEVGGTYDLVEAPEPQPEPEPMFEPPAPGPKGKPSPPTTPTKGQKAKAAPGAISDEEKSDLLSNLEKWAEE